jgi:ribose transport system substrate-binding protein
MNAKIPVVTVDSGLSPNISDSFLATDNVGAAAAVAKYAATHLMNKKGEYGIIDFNHTASTGILRPEGFKKGMKQFPNIKMVGKVEYSQNSISTGESEANNMIVQYPNMKVIFGANDRSALGPAEAVASSNSKVKLVGFDADLGEIKFIKNGIIQASILQSPYDMGYYGVTELIDLHEGKSVPKLVNTGFYLLTPKNLGTSKATKAIQQYAPSYKP